MTVPPKGRFRYDQRRAFVAPKRNPSLQSNLLRRLQLSPAIGTQNADWERPCTLPSLAGPNDGKPMLWLFWLVQETTSVPALDDSRLRIVHTPNCPCIAEARTFALPHRTTYNHGQMHPSICLAIDLTGSARSELRWELAGVGIGFILLSIGIAGLAFFLFRRQSRDFALVYFSSFSLLYAVRLLLREGIVRSVFPADRSALDHFTLAIDCFIVIPFTLL